MTIILCGYMGSGKSLIGNKLAKRLNFQFLDLDCVIEMQEGQSIPDIFKSKGEIAFRKAEMKALKTQLEADDDVVLALGGGTPCYGQNLEVVKNAAHAKTFYLKVDLTTLTERLFAERAKRPLISRIEDKEELNDFIRKHLFERQFYYLQCGQKIEASHLSADDIVEEIAGQLV